MSIVKTFHYPVDIEWWGNDLMNAQAPEKSALRVAPPHEFGGSYPNFWSPEELLVNAVGSCYAITLRAICERLNVPLHDLKIEAAGSVEAVKGGGYRFTVIDLDVALETEAESVKEAERASALAEKRCMVSRSLDTPVHVRLIVRTRLDREAVVV